MLSSTAGTPGLTVLRCKPGSEALRLVADSKKAQIQRKRRSTESVNRYSKKAACYKRRELCESPSKTLGVNLRIVPIVEKVTFAP